MRPRRLRPLLPTTYVLPVVLASPAAPFRPILTRGTVVALFGGDSLTNFSVDPDALRPVADKIDAIRAEVAAGGVSGLDGDVGHADLATAAADLQVKASSSWSEQVRALQEVVTRLRGSAALYEKADQDAVPRVAAADEGLMRP